MVIGVIVGGLLGLGISSIQKPEYEAISIFSFSIDYSRTGLLTDIEEDQAMEIVGDLIKSTDVMKQVEIKAASQGLVIDGYEIQKNFIAERKFDQWNLKVRNGTAETAAQLVNLWSEEVKSALEKAHQASWKADALHRYILSLESCYQQSTSGLAGQPLCQASNRMELLEEMEKSGKDLQNWQNDAKGIFPGLNFLWAQHADVPDKPIQHSRGSLILAGCLAGLLSAFLIAEFTYKI